MRLTLILALCVFTYSIVYASYEPYHRSEDSSLVKRRLKCQPGPVQKAWLNKKSILANGNRGCVYKTEYDGHLAVIKRIGGEKFDMNEIINLKRVQQFLGYGYEESKKGEKVYYIVAKYLGIGYDKAYQLLHDMHYLRQLDNDADYRYYFNYQMEYQNPHHALNHVYCIRSGPNGEEWESNPVDWAFSTYHGEDPPPYVPNPERFCNKRGFLGRFLGL